MITIIITVFVSMAMSMPARSQATIHQTNSAQYNIRQWNYRNGLASSIYAMCQTQDGFLWIGNEFGITRFDGSAMVLFNRQNSKEITGEICR
ncbi:MAG: two-component regulator propeller domain-containing protein, partial [Bacteroidota bacterium]